jgi:hypothetical protein
MAVKPLHQVAKIFPSGLNATEFTSSGCSIALPMAPPFETSHSRAVLSALPEAKMLPQFPGIESYTVTGHFAAQLSELAQVGFRQVVE